MSDFRNLFYSNYVDFKSWTFSEDPILNEVYDIEFQKLNLKGPLKILEIGFGNGSFLQWSKKNNFEITGVELIPELVKTAQKNGFKAHHLSVLDIPQSLLGNEKFDVIAAFDVLEHLYPDEILNFLEITKKLLTSHGKIWIRCPNGGSLAGQIQQMKDITHVTTLSKERFEQLTNAAQMKLELVTNSARTYKNRRRPVIFKHALYFSRNLIEILFGWLYFGHRIPLDPNIQVVIRNK